MPGAPLIEQVEPDSSAKEAAGGIFQLPDGATELNRIQEAKPEKVRQWDREGTR